MFAHIHQVACFFLELEKAIFFGNVGTGEKRVKKRNFFRAKAYFVNRTKVFCFHCENIKTEKLKESNPYFHFFTTYFYADLG